MTAETSIRPLPTDEEAVAIAAAVEATWPRAVQVVPAEHHSEFGTWRFSGRWWNLPIPVRRNRPWH